MKATIIALGALLALSACSQNQVPAGQLNEAASLPTAFNVSKLGLRVLTSVINQRQGTTATLYGNDRARQHLALGGAGGAQPGQVLALLTWRQQPDPNWFGARIPGALQSLELLRTRAGTAGRPVLSYQCFVGKALTLKADTLHQQARIAYLLAQKPAVLP